jgi:glycosyltransferase involved in cell wall biosynthesis
MCLFLIKKIGTSVTAILIQFNFYTTVADRAVLLYLFLMFMKILFLAPYPQKIGASQRFRFEHYLSSLKEHNISYSYKTFIAAKDYSIIFSAGDTLKKGFVVFKGMLKRMATLFTLHTFDFVYIHREVTPFGPPIFEWLIAKIWQKKIIYDFDDAIWIPQSSNVNLLANKIKCAWKVASICKWSYIVSVGNNFLADYAKQYCSDVRFFPTVVDTDNAHNKIKNQAVEPLTIGWTGTFTNFVHLPLVFNALKKLQEKYNFKYLLIADKDPLLKHINYEYIKWNKETEIADLLRMNIGIMPLIDTDVQLGKCAFKAIQYMALGIPSVVSPVGANCEVVKNEVDGYWADNDEEWHNSLERLLISEELRLQMGKNARTKIIKDYSVEATKSNFLNIFNAIK